MNYQERHKLVSAAFNYKAQEAMQKLDNKTGLMFIPAHRTRNLFHKEFAELHEIRCRAGISATDENIRENTEFVYPVFTPLNKNPSRVIILLHGLNERSWEKYFAWAHYLTEQTGHAVILFPIAYHINRAPKDWATPRQMSELMRKRRSEFKNSLLLSSFINSALSERLTIAPERFFLSGLQTAYDLISLVDSIKTGVHPLFKSPAGVDYFGYSIGGFLAQVLFIANPQEICKESRLMLFCSGSVFEDMNGISKMIMDNQAFQSLTQFYLNQTREKETSKGFLIDFIKENPLGNAFRIMVSHRCFRKIREQAFSALQKQIRAIGVAGDKVIPADRIQQTLTFGKQRSKTLAKTVELGSFFTHENPFPLRGDDKQNKVVNQAFEQVFSQAAMFLA